MADTLIVNDTTKITTGAIATWYVKSGASTADGWVDLGTLADADIKFTSRARASTYGSGLPHGYSLVATAKVLGTAKAACLQKLNLLNQYFNSHFFTLKNGLTMGGTSHGTRWRFVCEGGYDNDRYLEITADITVPFAASAGVTFSSFWDPTIGTAATSADPLYGFAPGNPLSAGWYTLALASGSNASATLTHFTNSSLIVEPITVKDDKGCSLQIACNMTLAFDWMQTDESGDIDTWHSYFNVNRDADVVLTLLDGTIITAPNMAGISLEYNAGGNMDRIAFGRISLDKKYTPAEWVALLS